MQKTPLFWLAMFLASVTGMTLTVAAFLFLPQFDTREALERQTTVRVALKVFDSARFAYTFTPPLPSAEVAAQKQQWLVETLTAPAVGSDAGVKPVHGLRVLVDTTGVQFEAQPRTQKEAERQLASVRWAMKQAFGAGRYAPAKPEWVLAHPDAQVRQQVGRVLVARLHGIGVREVSAKPHGADQVVVTIVGSPEMERVRSLLVAPGRLEFRLPPQEVSVSVDDLTGEVVCARKGIGFPPDDVVTESFVMLTGRAFQPTSGTTVDAQQQPAVSFALAGTAERERAAAMTNAYVGRRMLLVVDGKVLAAPVLNRTFFGYGVLSGGFRTTRQAENLASLLNAGPLPAPVKVLEMKTQTQMVE